MIDPNLLRNNLDFIIKQLNRRNFSLDIKMLKKQEKYRKELQIKIEKLRAKRNFLSKKIGIDKLKGQNVDEILSQVNKIKINLIRFENKFKNIQQKFYNYILSIPNILAEDIPFDINGNNLEIYYWGNPKKYDFPILNHLEIGELYGELDFVRGSKLSGSRFLVMNGKIAKLHRALIQFMLDVHINNHNYKEYYLPYLVNNNSLYGSGQLPKFDSDLFFVKTSKDDEHYSYALIPTAEVPIMNLFRNEIVQGNKLPIKIVAHTPCFRLEAGSYGKNNRGLIRMHQFDKVEITQITKPKYSMTSLEELTNHAEKILQLLNLPYRKVLLCSSNTGFTSCKTYDLEVWFPSYNSYREISSCSNVSDFQSRRMSIRYRSNNNKLKLVHTINGSGLAVSRTLAAILENYQTINGKVIIPKVLIPYMNGLNYIN